MTPEERAEALYRQFLEQIRNSDDPLYEPTVAADPGVKLIRQIIATEERCCCIMLTWKHQASPPEGDPSFAAGYRLAARIIEAEMHARTRHSLSDLHAGPSPARRNGGRPHRLN